MAKWKKNEKLGRALGREAGNIAKGVGKELLFDCNAGIIQAQQVPEGQGLKEELKLNLSLTRR